MNTKTQTLVPQICEIILYYTATYEEMYTEIILLYQFFQLFIYRCLILKNSYCSVTEFLHTKSQGQ